MRWADIQKYQLGNEGMWVCHYNQIYSIKPIITWPQWRYKCICDSVCVRVCVCFYNKTKNKNKPVKRKLYRLNLLTIEIDLAIFVCVCITHQLVHLVLVNWLSCGRHNLPKLLTINPPIPIPVATIIGIKTIIQLFTARVLKCPMML